MPREQHDTGKGALTQWLLLKAGLVVSPMGQLSGDDKGNGASTGGFPAVAVAKEEH